MSFSAFYAVRFSPAPELGEWLNVAVVGEGITDKKAGIVVTDSLKRIESAFGTEAVDRVVAISKDLSELVAFIAKARERGEETQPIATAMRDHALSLSFSDQIVVFEGTFQEGLASVAQKFLGPSTTASIPESVRAETLTKEEDLSQDILKIAGTVHEKLVKFSRDVFPSGVSKTLNQGKRALESIVHGPNVSTVLVIGAASHLGSALIPKLVESGKRIWLMEDPSMEGIDAVVYVPDHPLGAVGNDPKRQSDDLAAIKASAEFAKRHGVKKFIYAVPCGIANTIDPNLEVELKRLGDREFSVTILHLGEPYGHAKGKTWFGDLHDATGKLRQTDTVNALTAHAVLTGKVSAIDTDLRLFLHVEDAAASILAVLDASSEAVNGQTYTVGSEDQVRTISEIADLIKRQVPNADFIISMEEGEGLACPESLNRMTQELGFSPSQSIEEGIARLVASLTDGTYSRYMASQNIPPSENPTLETLPLENPASIQWEKLANASPNFVVEESISDESIRHH